MDSPLFLFPVSEKTSAQKKKSLSVLIGSEEENSNQRGNHLKHLQTIGLHASWHFSEDKMQQRETDTQRQHKKM